MRALSHHQHALFAIRNSQVLNKSIEKNKVNYVKIKLFSVVNLDINIRCIIKVS